MKKAAKLNIGRGSVQLVTAPKNPSGGKKPVVTRGKDLRTGTGGK